MDVSLPATVARPIPALLAETARAFRLRPAMHFMGRSWTYDALDEAVTRAARGLQDIGVGHGTRVGLCLPNTPYSVIFFFAVLRAGGVVVNFNPLYVERELAGQIADSGTEIMVTVDLQMVLPKLLAVGGLKRIVVCSMADALPWAKGLAFRWARRADIARVPEGGVCVRGGQLLRALAAPARVEIDPDSVAVLQYTGGTTGTPKAAALTHANITSNAEQCVAGMGDRPLGSDRILGVLPLFHVFALMTVMIVGVRTASEMILLPRFDLDQVLDAIGRLHPTLFPAVPTIYSALVNAAGRRRVDMSSIEVCMSGGAPLPEEVRARFMELTGCWLMEGYGLSETSPVVCYTPPGQPYKTGSVGPAALGTVIEIRDLEDARVVLPQGCRGEICIRGPQVMRGYWQRPEETAAVMIDGALRTGDVGYLDADGYLFIVDRIKDLIIAGGYNIYPRVLEEALYQHPGVRDAVVIGVADSYRGQAPKAFVTLKAGAVVSAAELRVFMSGLVSKIELPREIEIRDELPKTLIGKLSRKELVAEEEGKG